MLAQRERFNSDGSFTSAPHSSSGDVVGYRARSHTADDVFDHWELGKGNRQRTASLSSTGLRERSSTAGSYDLDTNNGTGTSSKGTKSPSRTHYNRERASTGESYSSCHSSLGGLRERPETPSTVDSSINDDASPSPPTQLRGTVVSFGSSNNNSSVSSGIRRRKIVDWIQRQSVPRRLRFRLWRSRSVLPLQSSGKEDDRVYLVSGLDRVLFGNMSAADAIVIAGIKPPRYLWYMISGACCDVVQFSADVLLHVIWQIDDASLCWALSFLLSIVFRHTSHRYFVFGDYVGGYWASLARMYAGYSIIIVLSTMFNIFATKVATLSHYFAWVLTLLWTGIANYFILKRIWSFGGAPSRTNKTVSSPAPSPSTSK